MILPFSKFFDKEKQQPTYFAEKINAALANTWREYGFHAQQYAKYLDTELFVNCENPKIHTIRTDEKNRWKEGNKIHAVYNNQQKNMYQFAPTFLCKGIQKIEIGYFGWDRYIKIDGVLLHPDRFNELAINDGFNSIADFFAYFNTDYTGKIIHFTNFRY